MNDPSNPRLARWWDGSGWTGHTIVKVQWRGPGAPPPPTLGLVPAIAPRPASRSTATRARSRTGLVDRLRTWPLGTRRHHR